MSAYAKPNSQRKYAAYNFTLLAITQPPPTPTLKELMFL